MASGGQDSCEHDLVESRSEQQNTYEYARAGSSLTASSPCCGTAAAGEAAASTATTHHLLHIRTMMMGVQPLLVPCVEEIHSGNTGSTQRANSSSCDAVAGTADAL